MWTFRPSGYSLVKLIAVSPWDCAEFPCMIEYRGLMVDTEIIGMSLLLVFRAGIFSGVFNLSGLHAPDRDRALLLLRAEAEKYVAETRSEMVALRKDGEEHSSAHRRREEWLSAAMIRMGEYEDGRPPEGEESSAFTALFDWATWDLPGALDVSPGEGPRGDELPPDVAARQ